MVSSSDGDAVVQHIPVLERETIQWLQDAGEHRRYVDATLGGGGHAAALLRAVSDIELLGIDRDEEARRRAAQTLQPWSDQVHIVSGTFSDVERHTAQLGWDRIDGIVADLGVSSFHFDQAARGFSFQASGPLDMRMDQTSGLSAAEWLAEANETEMEEVFRHYGEERFASRIAHAIAERREKQAFETTGDLAQEVVRAIPSRFRRQRIHPATRVFQAIRIWVNQELQQLEALLEKTPLLLRNGGRLVVISYHSLEDRMVKRSFRVWSTKGFHLPVRKVVQATEEEIKVNPRARSAKLRVLEKEAV